MPANGRRRCLVTLDKGKALERELTSEQRMRFAAAYKDAGAVAVEGFRKVMLGIMDAKARKRFLSPFET